MPQALRWCCDHAPGHWCFHTCILATVLPSLRTPPVAWQRSTPGPVAGAGARGRPAVTSSRYGNSGFRPWHTLCSIQVLVCPFISHRGYKLPDEPTLSYVACKGGPCVGLDFLFTSVAHRCVRTATCSQHAGGRVAAFAACACRHCDMCSAWHGGLLTAFAACAVLVPHAVQVQQVFADCDRDSIIYLSDPIGPACHTGAK